MNITRDAVIDTVAKAVHADTATAFVTAQRLRMAPIFPAVEIRQIDKTRTRSAITLDFEDEQHTLTFESQVYCDEPSGGLDEAFRIMGIVEAALNGLYFVEMSCNEVDNQDPDIARVVARFSRQVCDGDLLTVAANDTDNTQDNTQDNN